MSVPRRTANGRFADVRTHDGADAFSSVGSGVNSSHSNSNSGGSSASGVAGTVGIAGSNAPHSDATTGMRPRGGVDYSSVALYVPALQVLLSLSMMCTTMLFVTMLSSGGHSSAPRAAITSGIVGLAVVFRPIRVDECHGMDLVFDTVRPSVLAYWVAIVVEQLVHTCAIEATQTPSMLRRALFHVCVLAAMVGGFARAYRPRSQDDVPFLLALVALLIIGLFPPSPSEACGPLCRIDGAWDAGERLVRAVLFGLVFCALAYASEPNRHSVGEICLCAARATAASAWVLGVPSLALPLAIAQAVLAIARRLRSTRARSGGYELAKGGSGDDAASIMSASDVEGGMQEHEPGMFGYGQAHMFGGADGGYGDDEPHEPHDPHDPHDPHEPHAVRTGSAAATLAVGRGGVVVNGHAHGRAFEATSVLDGIRYTGGDEGGYVDDDVHDVYENGANSRASSCLAGAPPAPGLALAKYASFGVPPPAFAMGPEAGPRERVDAIASEDRAVSYGVLTRVAPPGASFGSASSTTTPSKERMKEIADAL